jgi:signal transduction histidine kinase
MSSTSPSSRRDGSRYDRAQVVAARSSYPGRRGLVLSQIPRQGSRLPRSRAGHPPSHIADPEKVRQILLNLLSNAIKFTPGGAGSPRRGRLGATDVGITVADSGIGIARKQMDSIFEPFVQVDADLTRTAQGTGLGLAISMELARRWAATSSPRAPPGRAAASPSSCPPDPAAANSPDESDGRDPPQADPP